MSLILWITVITGIVAAINLAIYIFGDEKRPDRWSKDYGWVSIFGGLSVASLGLFALVGLCALVIMGGRAAGANICSNFGKQAGFPSKMVVLNWSDTGTCLVKTPSGRWVKNNNLYQFINGGN